VVNGPYKVEGHRLVLPPGTCLAISPDQHWLETWQDILNASHAAAYAAGRADRKKEIVERLRAEAKEDCGGSPCPFLPNLANEIEALP